ncbi:MAG: response regulator transcription factor [Bacteroidia bacterium]|nr:response regulator transcription factor [Bacteroidia bacterium]
MDTKIRTLVIDDEDKSRKYLRQMLTEFCPEVEVVGEADSMLSGLEAIAEFNPQLVFLDIKMPHGTGFDLLERIEEYDFEVIFTTAHDNYAIKAIRFSALDYLLKPIDIDELQAAVAKVKKKISSQSSALDNQLKMFFANLKNQGRKNKQVALPTNEGIFFMPLEDILRCEADGSYTRIYRTNKEEILISKNLKEVEGLLDEMEFCRVHKSHLIGLAHVVRYVKGKGGEAIMSDGTRVEVSIRKREELLEKLMSR